MSLICQITECIHNTTAQPDISLLRKTKLLCNSICCLKSNTPDIICHLERIFFHFIQTFISVLTVNFGCKRGTDAMILQKKHHIFNLFLPFPAVSDHLDSFFTDAVHFLQPGNIRLNHFQRFYAKLCYDLFRIFRANALDQTGTKIFFNAKNSGRHGFLPAFCQELSAIFRIYLPIPINQKY